MYLLFLITPYLVSYNDFTAIQQLLFSLYFIYQTLKKGADVLLC